MPKDNRKKKRRRNQRNTVFKYSKSYLPYTKIRNTDFDKLVFTTAFHKYFL